MNPSQSVTVTNVFGPLNRGDFELFHQLLNLLEANGTADVHAVAREPEECRQFFGGATFHEQPGVAPEIKGKARVPVALLRTGILFLAAWVPAAERLLPASQRTSLAAIRDANLVIACPGGYLTNSSWSFYPQLAQLEYAVRRGPKVWLAPMSIGPAPRRLHRLVLGRILNAVDRIYVRESWSERFCDELGLDSIRSADLAYRPARDWLLDDLARTVPEHITATVVRWNFPGEADPGAARDRYHQAMAKSLNTAARQYNLPVKLLLQVDNDRKVTEAVAALLDVPHEIVRVDTPDEYRAILRRSRLMIGSRFHSAIFAMTVGCPTVVVSYLPKARYMMEDMGLDDLVHDITQVRADDLLQSVARLDDPALDLLEKARTAIVAQTEDPANPFVIDLQGELRAGPR